MGVASCQDDCLGNVASTEDPRECAYGTIDSLVGQIPQDRSGSYEQRAPGSDA